MWNIFLGDNLSSGTKVSASPFLYNSYEKHECFGLCFYQHCHKQKEEHSVFPLSPLPSARSHRTFASLSGRLTTEVSWHFLTEILLPKGLPISLCTASFLAHFVMVFEYLSIRWPRTQGREPIHAHLDQVPAQMHEEKSLHFLSEVFKETHFWESV